MTEETKRVEKTFVDKVLNFLQGGDEGAIKAILKNLSKKWLREIEEKEYAIDEVQRASKYDISEQEEYLEGAIEALNEAYMNINLMIKGKQAILSYIPKYEKQIADAKAVVAGYEKTISTIKATRVEVLAELKDSINELQEDLKVIQNV